MSTKNIWGNHAVVWADCLNYVPFPFFFKGFAASKLRLDVLRLFGHVLRPADTALIYRLWKIKESFLAFETHHFKIYSPNHWKSFFQHPAFLCYLYKLLSLTHMSPMPTVISPSIKCSWWNVVPVPLLGHRNHPAETLQRKSRWGKEEFLQAVAHNVLQHHFYVPRCLHNLLMQ